MFPQSKRSRATRRRAADVTDRSPRVLGDSDSVVRVTTTETVPSRPEASNADAFMKRFLRVDSAKTSTQAEAQSAFQKSILVSSVRCILTYVFFPFIAPALGMAASVGRPLGIAISLVAMVSIVISMRRFWRSDHPKRWHYTVLGGTVFVFLVVSLAVDVVGLI